MDIISKSGAQILNPSSQDSFELQEPEIDENGELVNISPSKPADSLNV